MNQHQRKYKGIFSSDWSECLSPSGPFDFIDFLYPQLAAQTSDIFRQYTGNAISLGEASRKINSLLPAPVSEDQMDAYLKQAFVTYTGVPELMEWCLANDILFMVNTTGMIGYFQRAFAGDLLPGLPVLSANPLVRFPSRPSDPRDIYDLLEIQDKGKNTEQAARAFGIPPDKIIIMGDSGGDGAHFQWGWQHGAMRIGSMTKPSLEAYCRRHEIPIDLHFGLAYPEGAPRELEKEMAADFRALVPVIQRLLSLDTHGI